jgi:hypothetical protein
LKWGHAMPPWALSPGHPAPALRWGPRQPFRGTEGDLPTSGGTLESAVACETRVLGPMASRSSPALAPGAKRLPRGCARGYRTSKGTRSRARAQAGTCGGLRLGGPGEGGPAPRRSGAAPRLGPPASDSLPWREPAARSRLHRSEAPARGRLPMFAATEPWRDAQAPLRCIAPVAPF